MERRHLRTIKWAQPYATDYQRPYLKHLQQELEQLIEVLLEVDDFSEAQHVIAKIKNQL